MRIPHGFRAALASQGAAPSAYQIQRSLRFNSADSAYLSRTPASAGNRKTWTWSGWVKRSGLGVDSYLFTGNNDATNTTLLRFTSTDKLRFFTRVGAGDYVNDTNAVFRDASAWYHVVCAIDTTAASAADRVKLYVNGINASLTATPTIPQNSDLYVNATNIHYIGALVVAGTYSSGYLADVHFIDGQALTPTSFAETNATTGQWVPKAYSGSYGTNGFKLDFADNSNTTAGTLGKDTSGNGLNWTPSGFSVTAGADNDSLVDTPTSYGTDTGAGGEVRGNYATLNPLSNAAGALSDGNLRQAGTASVSVRTESTIAVSSGKWYFEVTPTALAGTFASLGIGTIGLTNKYPGEDANSYSWYPQYVNKQNSTSATSYGSAVGVNGVVMVAFDLDNNKIFFGGNGTWFGSSNPANGTNPAFTINAGTYTPIFRAYDTGSAFAVNFGQRPFAYTAPSGFKALCDTNLPTPAIAKPNTVMDVLTYTGNGSARSITGLGFNPDLVWIKARSGSGTAYVHNLYDSIRSTGYLLDTSSTAAEINYPGYGLSAFNSDGFSLIGSGSLNNENGSSYVAWCWDKSATPGFDIVTYTGNGASGRDIAHSLGVKPSMIITKARTDATYSWHVWHTGIGADYYLALNTTGVRDNSVNVFPYAGITSSSFRTSTAAVAYNNLNAVTYVAYLWSEIAGFSKFGSYTGNGSTDGPFVYTGFRPRWVMIKASSASGEWGISDAARDQYNVVSNVLLAENSGADNTGLVLMDFTSNGFKLRNSNVNRNTNGTTYIYAAFAQNPFQYARAR